LFEPNVSFSVTLEMKMGYLTIAPYAEGTKLKGPLMRRLLEAMVVMLPARRDGCKKRHRWQWL
jgi:hypothetical protein